jgi:cbb3-type cytochrome oxidase subunit 1
LVNFAKGDKKMNDNKRLTKFFVASSLFFIWVTVQGALQAQQAVHDFISLAPAAIIVGAHVHIGTLGWISMTLEGMLYYLVPLVSGKAISWPRLVNWVFWLETITIPVIAVLMIGAGISGGKAFQPGVTGDALNAVMAPYMILVGIFSIVCGLVAILFSVQIIHTATKKSAN